MTLKHYDFSNFNLSKLNGFLNQDILTLLSEQSERVSIFIIDTDGVTLFQQSANHSKQLEKIQIDQSNLNIQLDKSDCENAEPLILLFHLNNSFNFSLNLAPYTHAELMIVQNTQSENQLNHEINIEQHAHLKSLWCIAHSQTERKMSDNSETENVHAIRRKVQLGKNSIFYDHQIFTPETVLNVYSNIQITGSHAHSVSTGCLISETGELYYEPVQEHFAPSAKSELKFNVVLSNKAKSFFRGLITLHSDAQKSEAFQQNKNLLLSRSARADAEPRLEIIPNDVMCKHGSATAELDKKQIYYLMSRGFNQKAAKNMIIKGFCNLSPQNTISHESIFNSLHEQIRDYYLTTQVGILN